MKKNKINNLGTINIESLEVSNGQMEVFIPVELISDELDVVLEKCAKDFKEHNPEVKMPCFNLRLVFSFGYANPEFELLVVMFDEASEEFEEYDSCFIGDVELSEEQTKQIKKVMWDKLGETLFNLQEVATINYIGERLLSSP